MLITFDKSQNGSSKEMLKKNYHFLSGLKFDKRNTVSNKLFMSQGYKGTKNYIIERMLRLLESKKIYGWKPQHCSAPSLACNFYCLEILQLTTKQPTCEVSTF